MVERALRPADCPLTGILLYTGLVWVFERIVLWVFLVCCPRLPIYGCGATRKGLRPSFLPVGQWVRCVVRHQPRGP